MSDALSEITVQPPSDPDAQATVTDFLDYTEYLPSELIRSLTLIRKLDTTYLSASSSVHELTKTYGALPKIPPDERPDPQTLRTQISKSLQRALNAREYSYAEASRLYDVVDRHYNRLTSIISKLRSLPQPPSRDPSPVPGSATSPQSQRARGGRKSISAPAPTPRITLRLDGARQNNAARSQAQTDRQKKHARRVVVPGEVLPPQNPESFSLASPSEWESAPNSPLPVATSRVGGSRNRPKPVRIRVRKPEKPLKIKLPKEPRSRRPPGSMGTNVHSAVAGISTSNALALLNPPPQDAAPGSDDAPWFRLTPWEMAKLRKRMKKNAVWTPSETMIRRELADLGRGPEKYQTAKAHAAETGEEFDDLLKLAQAPGRKALAEGEISAEAVGTEDMQLSNRGMKLNEAKKLKKENLQKELAAQAAAEAEQAAQRLADSGSALKSLFIRPGAPAEPPTPSRRKGRETLKLTHKRKREDSSAEDDNLALKPDPDPTSPSKVRKRKSQQVPPPISTTTTTITVPLRPSSNTPTPTTAASTITARKPIPTPSTRRSSTSHPPSRPRSRAGPSTGTTSTPTSTTTAGKDRPRRASAISNPPSAAPGTRRGKRPVPGRLTKESSEGGPPISVGRRTAAPRRKSTASATTTTPTATTAAAAAAAAAAARKKKKAAQAKVAAAAAAAQREEDDDEEEEDEEDMPIDPNEPRYCVCGDVSWGTMVMCENRDCEREWFHLECVGLKDSPGRSIKWYCPDCRRNLGIGEKGQALSGGGGGGGGAGAGGTGRRRR